MKRPFAVIGITYLFSQAVAVYLGTAATLIAAISIALLCILYCSFFRNRNKAIVTAAITACIAMLFSFGYTKLFVESSIPMEGESVFIKGQIIEEPYSQYGRYYYVVKTDYIGFEGARQKAKIRISSKESLEAEYSDIFEGEVIFNVISNDNSFASKTRLLSKGITSTAFVSEAGSCSVSPGKAGLYGYAIKIRNKLKSTINKLYPDETADILIAMITGDESTVENNTLNGFRDIGIAHILAVSGLHLTLLAYAITWLLRRFLVNRKIIAIVVFIFAWTYAAVAGFPMSSVRAAIMITVMLLGIVVERLHTPLNSLGIAMLLICLFRPYAAIDAGLLMSFSSTFGLITVAPELNAYIQRVLFKNKSSIVIGILRKIVSLLVCSFTASVFILPVSVLLFGKVSLLSPIANLLLIPIAELFLSVGMIASFIGVFGAVGQMIAYPFMAVDWGIGKVMLWAVELFDSIPGAVLNTGNRTEFAVFGCVVIALLWAVLFYRSKFKKITFVLCSFCCIIITFVWFCSGYFLTDSKTITVYNAGDTSMVLARDRQSTVLIGAGSSDYDVSLAQYDMQNKGITEITALVLTDLSKTGAGCADSIIEEMNPCEVFVSGSGGYYDTVKYISDKNSIACSSAENMSLSTGEVNVSSLYDAYGKLWTCITSGEINVVVCPKDGNALDCPFGYEFDAVLMQGEVPSCIAAFNAKVYILSAEYENGAIAVSQLKARGLKNVYCTGVNGNIELAVRDGRLYIGGEDL